MRTNVECLGSDHHACDDLFASAGKNPAITSPEQMNPMQTKGEANADPDGLMQAVPGACQPNEGVNRSARV